MPQKKRACAGKKIIVFLLIFIFLGAMLAPLRSAQAQLIVFNPEDSIWKKIQTVITTLWRKGGSLALQQTARNALNKIAYDTATWVGSGAEGQGPLYVDQGWGSYMAQIGDEAAGDFLENFSSNLSTSAGKELSFNFCQPSSLNARVKISLGLAQQYRPQGPNCTASTMIANWESAAQRYADYKDPQFLDKFVDIFDPVSNEMGIFWNASLDMSDKEIEGEMVAKTTLLGQGGWLDMKGPDGKPLSLPNQAQLQTEQAYDSYSSNFIKYTGDAFVDAGRVFLNQLALTAFNKMMSNIGKKTGSSAPARELSLNFDSDPTASSGETAVRDMAVKLLQTDFGSKADYDILSELMMCPDSKNPGPTNCVIDSKFMQAISEQKTVAEALAGGYLRAEWQFTSETLPSGPEGSYSWRNVSILRKYRIVPASWEQVFDKLEKLNELAVKEPLKFSPKKATLQDLVSCFDPYDEYNQFSGQFNSADQAWCTGLVDPNWVLKAPLNYCRKEGSSPQIVNKYVIPSYPAQGETPYVPSTLSVVRADDYCADHQTCIREAKDGSCQAYGYCNEEKRTWSFSGDSCAPISNTCQSFTNSVNKQKVSYLENTLNYEGCSADNAGCKQYSYFGTYNLNTGTVAWRAADSIYFNSKAESCSSSEEGCSEFIRVKPAWGANLVMNTNFVVDAVGASTTGAFLNDWPVIASKATIVDAALDPTGNSGKALKLEGGNVSVFSNQTSSLLPENLTIIPGQAYTVSADVYLLSGSQVSIALGTAPNQSVYNSQLTGTWHHISVTKQAGVGLSVPAFSIFANGTLYVKNIKFEMSGWDTGFSSYGTVKSYQKVLPDYLENSCYVGQTANGYSYKIKEGAPTQCYNYARKCDQGEVGCELYTLGKKNFSVPAKVANVDYCPNECVGYDVYVSRGTYFTSPQAENMIPSTATQCNADAVGCSEFTNLDNLETGGEQREYYSALKHCIKPGSSCGSYYAWEGTNNGYQLRLYNLERAADGSPRTIADDNALCNATIFVADINSPLYNPDCKQFYDAAGNVFYSLASYTVTCSDNCRSYRITEKNYDNSLTLAQCNGVDKHWDAQEGSCISCLNGGIWNSTHNSCVYQGIPGEGKTCTAAQSGCREYNGNAGNNVRLVSSHNFESPSVAWTSNCSGGVSIVPISSNRDGHSLSYVNGASGCSEIGETTHTVSKSMPLIKQIVAGDNQAAQLSVGNSVKKDKAYSIRFWASSQAGANLNIFFYNKDTDEKASFNSGTPVKISSGGGWQLYSANLDNLGHNVSPNEVLAITANSDFYLDNFILTEIVDRYYLVKGSSRIPDICYYDVLDVYQGADYNLGCATYADRNGNGHNLHSFSELCSSDSVGCEQVISTQNSSSHQAALWGDTNNNGICDATEISCIKVPADSAMYLVFDRSKQCSVANLGCSRFGEAQTGTNAAVFSDVFRKDNPNNYNTILCDYEGLGCESWSNTDNGSVSYFRNPGNDICVYRSSTTQPSGQKYWYKAPVKRCDSNSDGQIAGGEQSAAVCGTNADCNNLPCIVDNNDYLCDVSFKDTIGYGGPGNRIAVPSTQVGLCDAKASGCREYIDPVSEFNPNLYTGVAPFAIQQNKLYLLTKSSSTAATITLRFNKDVAPLLTDNTFGTSTRVIEISGSQTAIFNSLDNTSVNSISGDLSFAVVRELVVEYQLVGDIDKTGCNGLVDFANGCVLFNERSISGASGYVSLDKGFDPYSSKAKSSPNLCDVNVPGSCASNQLIKVRPDRVCASWFDCATYAYDPETNAKVCYSLKQCNSLDEQGTCNNFIDDAYKPEPQNATGYYFLNRDSLGKMTEVGLNSSAHFDFEELVPALTCGRLDDPTKPCSFDRNIVKDLLIREPEKAKVDYPASGKSYLRVPSNYNVSPMAPGSYINLSGAQKYYLSFLANTKNSGASAQVIIEVRGAATTTSFTVSSPNGWKRFIVDFDSGSGNAKQVRIYLRAAGSTTGEGEVYFDDINIEPVLQVGEGDYAARECRIYPSSDSLSCKNQNKNVIVNGLEGYCLEHDRDNPSVCTTWYPADRISSSALSSNSLGYNGPLGLSYCTNINSNVEYAKKIKTKLVYANIDKSRGVFLGGVINFVNGLFGGTECPSNWNDPNQSDASFCSYCQNFNKERCITIYGSEAAWLSSCKQCIDRTGSDGAINMDTDGCGELGSNPRSDPFAPGITFEESTCEYHCGDCRYYRAIVINDKANWNHERVYCVPRETSPQFLLGVGAKTSAAVLDNTEFQSSSCTDLKFYEEAWMTYQGTFYQKPINLCEQSDDNSTKYECKPIDEYTNATPPIRVYNRDYPSVDEQGLQYLAADIANRDKVFNFSCSEFSQVVSSSGDNKAWAVRTGINSNPNDAFTTPDYFNNLYTNPAVLLQFYGRQRTGVPFGAATFGNDYDLLNSGPIYLQNQYYQKDKQTIFGGRPYDCSGAACNKVGYCSGNPSVICLFDPFFSSTTPFSSNYINQKTCSDGGFGECKPLWATSSPLQASTVLSQIFLQSYGTFTYQDGSYIPGGTPYSFPASAASINGQAPSIVGTPSLWKGNDQTGRATTTGIYSLKFNTRVNPEQQPLRMIYINWGDGNKQAITGQDHRPDANSPHVFYHYYSKPATSQVEIRIWDNWDMTGGWSGL